MSTKTIGRAVAANAAFSLVEVSLALALAAFALVVLLGALPAGLQAVQESQAQEVVANVVQRLQGSLQQISFAQASSGTTVDTLATKTFFYTQDGVDATDPARADTQSPPAYYKAVFNVNDAIFNDGTAGQTGTPLAQSSNARTVTITVWYPQSGVVSGNQRIVYSFLVAKQRLN